MKSSQVFPSRWLKADDLNGKRVRVTIREVRLEDFGGEDKPVMFFEGKDKGMVLNRTNWGRLEFGLGSDDSDDWCGSEIILQSEPVNFQGRTVNGLRVHIDKPVEREGDEEVPF